MTHSEDLAKGENPCIEPYLLAEGMRASQLAELLDENSRLRKQVHDLWGQVAVSRFEQMLFYCRLDFWYHAIRFLAVLTSAAVIFSETILIEDEVKYGSLFADNGGFMIGICHCTFFGMQVWMLGILNSISRAYKEYRSKNRETFVEASFSDGERTGSNDSDEGESGSN